jgi:hypothetical protein
MTLAHDLTRQHGGDRRGSYASRLPYALDGLKRGFAVLPLHWPKSDLRCSCGDVLCASAAKHPYRRMAPRGLHSATRDRQATEKIWREVPPANIGLRTGEVIVVDVDTRHGGDASLAGLVRQYGELPQTWRCLTGGGGEHIYFRAPKGRVVRNSAGVIADGIDVRGEGGYVLAPGSQHSSGRTYAWSVDHHPDEVELAEAPDWLLTLAGGERKPARTPEQWRTIASQGVTEGKRNATATALYGHLVRRDVDAKVALELLRAWNIARCSPPLGDAEIVTIAASISERELSRRGARGGR